MSAFLGRAGFLPWTILMGTEAGTEGAEPGGEGGPRWEDLPHWTPFLTGGQENVVHGLPVPGRNEWLRPRGR